MIDKKGERLELLILLRLLAKTKKAPSRKEIATSLARYAAPSTRGAAWQELVDAAISKLSAEQQVRAHEARIERVEITEAGRDRLASALGVSLLPQDVPWRVACATYLSALALGVAPATPEHLKRLATADGLRATLLGKRHRLPVRAVPTLGQAIDALVSRALGLDEREPLSLNRVRLVALRRLLGRDFRLDLEEAKRALAAEAAGTLKGTPDGLRDALVRGWLEDSTPTRAEGHPPSDLFDVDLASFAARVKAAAAGVVGRSGRFGHDRVFISAVFDALVKDTTALRHAPRDDPQSNPHALTLQRFKDRLIEANRAGLLSLSRADLVAAMDPEAVVRSEIKYLNATFHFVEDQPS